jgi:hypothetical protein
MSEYTAERAEHRANHFENAGILDIAAMLRAYAATLRQQATNPPEIGSKLVGDGAVSDEVRLFSGDLDVLANLGFPKTAERIRAVLYRDVAPLLRAPAEQGSAVSPKMGNATACTPTMDRGGRVDEGMTIEEKCKVIQENRDYWYGVAEEYRQKLFDAEAALAQNAQGELPLVEVTIVPFNGGSRLDFSSRDWWHKLPTGTHKLYTHAERARVPEGMVLVPREPTPEMRAAHSIHGDTSDWWNAVISAAPSHPEDAA